MVFSETDRGTPRGHQAHRLHMELRQAHNGPARRLLLENQKGRGGRVGEGRRRGDGGNCWPGCPSTVRLAERPEDEEHAMTFDAPSISLHHRQLGGR